MMEHSSRSGNARHGSPVKKTDFARPDRTKGMQKKAQKHRFQPALQRQIPIIHLDFPLTIRLPVRSKLTINYVIELPQLLAHWPQRASKESTYFK
jgi:hypothetical protein